MHLLDLLSVMSLALLIAKILGGFFKKIGIPSVLAELTTGILIGNLALLGPGLSLFAPLGNSELINALSEIGVLFLLFVVGLETDLNELGKVGVTATIVAVTGVVAPFVLAFAFLPNILGGSFNHTLFMAAALTATSVGITARVLKDVGKLNSTSGKIILGAAVIDDILGIVVLAVVSAIAVQGTVSGFEMGLLLLKIAIFALGVMFIRRYLLKPILASIRPLEVSGSVTIFLVSMAILAAWAAEKSGLAGIVGAFALGVVLDDVHFKGYHEKGVYRLEEIMKPISDFFVPIFFIAIGMKVKLGSLFDPQSITLAGILLVLAFLGKLACGWALSRSQTSKGADRLLVGFGMVPRGEVGLIFAAVGTRLGVLNDADYAAVISMVAVTTLAAPFLISWRARRL